MKLPEILPRHREPLAGHRQPGTPIAWTPEMDTVIRALSDRYGWAKAAARILGVTPETVARRGSVLGVGLHVTEPRGRVSLREELRTAASAGATRTRATAAGQERRR